MEYEFIFPADSYLSILHPDLIETWGTGSTMKIELYAKQINELLVEYNEWRLPNTIMSFKLNVARAGTTRYTELIEAEGNYDIYLGPRIVDHEIRLQMVVVVQQGDASVLNIDPSLSGIFTDQNF